jgi:hypothetical protein
MMDKSTGAVSVLKEMGLLKATDKRNNARNALAQKADRSQKKHKGKLQSSTLPVEDLDPEQLVHRKEKKKDKKKMRDEAGHGGKIAFTEI